MANKIKINQALVDRGLVSTRSQANNYIRLGKVRVEGKIMKKPDFFVNLDARIQIAASEKYVSRAGLKLGGVADLLKLNFSGKVVLDVGSSTGGFTDYALQHGAKLIIAVDVGTNQLHESLRGNTQIELHEKTDIRDVALPGVGGKYKVIIEEAPDYILADVSFLSLREIIPHLVVHLSGSKTQLVVMVKPQFEAKPMQLNQGVVKNDTIRRQILKDFEAWLTPYAKVVAKADSKIAGRQGNRERFYLLNVFTSNSIVT